MPIRNRPTIGGHSPARSTSTGSGQWPWPSDHSPTEMMEAAKIAHGTLARTLSNVEALGVMPAAERDRHISAMESITLMAKALGGEVKPAGSHPRPKPEPEAKPEPPAEPPVEEASDE